MPSPPVLHLETRVSSSPIPPSQILHIYTDPNAAAAKSAAAGRKRTFDQISELNESSYAQHYLATEGSIFFRSKQRAPRCHLWRVLDNRKILDIQNVDLVHDGRDERTGLAEGLTIRIHVPAGIVKNGIAFADPDETDALEAYLLTSANELYTIILKRDLLLRDSVPHDLDPTSCVQKHSISSLTFRHPYKLIATSHLELLVSLHDGGILRLDRSQGENGTHWRETIYSEGNWGDTIRGLISLKRHQTVPYGDRDLEPGAIAAMASSPDGGIIWTVTLDHQLKAWNSKSGKPVQQIDLLNERLEKDDRATPKYIMSADQGTLLQVIGPHSSGKKQAKVPHDGNYFVICRSPKDNQFKFYEVSPSPDDSMERIFIQDLQPTMTLIPPIDDVMDTGMWHLEDFYISASTGWQGAQLWLRARNGKLCRTFTLTFNLLDKKGNPAEDLDDVWQGSWTSVNPGGQTVEALESCDQFPRDHDGNVLDTPFTPSERWLRFLFHPDRFSESSIETTLNIYSNGRGRAGSKASNETDVPLQQRLTQAVASKVLLTRLPDDQPDYARYQDGLRSEWNTFYSLLRDLHDRRNDSIGLALDSEEGLAWSVFADYSSPIRAGSQLEVLEANEVLLDDESKLESIPKGLTSLVLPSREAIQVCQVLAASKAFSAGLSADFRESFAYDVICGSLEEGTSNGKLNEQRVQDLYERHQFSAQVMDDDFENLERAAQGFGGLGDLNDSAILGVLEWMQHDVDAAGARTHKVLNGYGEQFVMAVAQETLEHNRRTLLNLLVLVIFMYGDLDRADLHPDFVSQIGSIYEAITGRLKNVELLSWLAGNVISAPQSTRKSLKVDSAAQEPEQTVVTLLQRLFIGDWDPHSHAKDGVAVELSKWAKQWTYGAKIEEAWEGIVQHILAVLIKERALSLASDFLKFLPDATLSEWLTYLEGRLFLATGRYQEASLMFEAASEGTGDATQISAADTAHLLSAEEQNYFGDGQSRFYQHVSALYEKLKIYSYAADFAKLALTHLESGNDAGASSLIEIDRQKALTDSPAHQRAGHALHEIDILKEYERRKEEICIRLFTALVETGRFHEALDALAGISERPMRNANLSALVKACIERDAVPTLLELPFEAADLSQEADTALLALAKKSLASGSSSIPYHQILYAFRAQHSDFRGAAEILYEHLQRLKHLQSKHGILDPEEETLVHAYILLINTMACCGEDDAWLLADPIEEIQGAGAKRRLVTIADVRREYSAELDKRSEILQGRFPLLGDAEPMDVL